MMYNIYMKVILCLFIFMLTLPLFAQPVGEESWLRVVITSPDGLPVSLSTGMVPELYLIDGVNKRRDGTAQIVVKDGEINLIGLTVGPHEFFVTLGSYGFRFGPREINITPGPNIYEWTLPKMTQAEIVVMDGNEKVKVNNPLCFIIPKSRGSIIQTVGYGANGLAVLKGLLPDTYQVMVISREPDYYIFANVVVPDSKEEPVKVNDAKVLKVNSSMTFTLSPPPVITVAYQLRITISGKFGDLTTSPYVITIRDKAEKIPMPPGNFTWSVYVPSCKPLTGKVTIGDNTNEKLDLKPTP